MSALILRFNPRRPRAARQWQPARDEQGNPLVPGSLLTDLEYIAASNPGAIKILSAVIRNCRLDEQEANR